jgi:hypothetical protein
LSFQKIINGGFSMPKKYKPFTDHISYAFFGQLGLKYSGEIARNQTGLSLEFRLFLLGLQRMSNKGHAPFSRGEIASLLLKPNGTKFSSRHIDNQIVELAKSGALSPESNVRCLVYPRELIHLKTDKKKSATCPEHGTHSSWSAYNRDWAPDYPLEVSNSEVIVPESIENSEEIDWADEYMNQLSGTISS